MAKADGILATLEKAMETAIKYTRYLPLVVLGVLLVTSSVSYYRGLKHTKTVSVVKQEQVIVATYTIKKGDATKILALDDIVSRDMVPVEIRFNKPDSLTEFGEWQKVNGGIQFPHQVTFVQYRALTDTFTVRIKAPRTKS